jgi:PAP2 superfamily
MPLADPCSSPVQNKDFDKLPRHPAGLTAPYWQKEQTMSSILEWNEKALEVQRTDFDASAPSNAQMSGPQQGGPTKSSRALAIVHLAMHDAAVAYKTKPASELDAAVAGAACQTLGSLFDRQAKPIQKLAAQFVGALPGNTEKNREALYAGHTIGEKRLVERRGDGWDAPEIYVSAMAPNQSMGIHAPDPLHPNQGVLGTQWGEVRPFCLPEKWKLRDYISAYPGIGTPAYNASKAQVEDLGAWDSANRTTDQTDIGIFWGYDGANKLGTPPRLYNQCVRAIIEKQAMAGTVLNTLELARLFALLNVGLADAAIVAWRAKYHFALWRPVVGIRAGGNGSADWRPLGAPSTNGTDWFLTPNFPAYPSGHATFGTTCFEIVRRFYAEKKGTPGDKDNPATGANLPFEFKSDEFNGVNAGSDGIVRMQQPRNFAGVDVAIKENILSRVYLGVHWSFDGAKFDGAGKVDYGLAPNSDKIGGAAAGYRVAKHVYANCFPN